MACLWKMPAPGPAENRLTCLNSHLQRSTYLAAKIQWGDRGPGARRINMREKGSGVRSSGSFIGLACLSPARVLGWAAPCLSCSLWDWMEGCGQAPWTGPAHHPRNSSSNSLYRKLWCQQYFVDTSEQIGEGNGTPLQCSCLEDPRDGGAWWAAVYGVAQSWTWLRRLSSSSWTNYSSEPV